MESKLTLRLKSSAIEKGKRYAKSKKTSLSKLIENYLEKIGQVSGNEEISPLVKSLTGVAKGDRRTWKERRDDYVDHLTSKYK